MADYQSTHTGLEIDAGITLAETSIQGVKVNGTELSKDANNKVNVDISGKVDKVSGYGLSKNDYSDTEKANVASNTSARHSHSNKDLLDTYTQTEANLADAVSKKHSHSNKEILDAVTVAYTTSEAAKITTIENKIPSAATSENQLADKAFVNSSISTATATFRGTVTAASDTEAAAQTALATITTKDNNDYANVKVEDSPQEGTDKYKRYTYNGSAWVFNYEINTTGFTSAQWAALNSGATAENIAAIAQNTAARHTHSNKAELDLIVSGDKTKWDNTKSAVDRIARDFGRYATPTNVTLSTGTSSKYIDKDTALEVSNSAYAISNIVSLAMGDILLIPSASAVLAACSVVSQKVTNTFDKVIIYTYTYDSLNRIATATADYDSSLVYTAYYASDESSTPDYWTISGSQVSSLPETHSVTESHYIPLVKQSVAAMPDEGYYVFLASQAMDVVVSAFTATVNGGIAIKVGWGIFKNIASNFVGIEKQRVIAEAIDTLNSAVSSIESKLANGIDKLSVRHLFIERELSGMNADGSFCLRAAGVPSADLTPENWNFDKYGDWKGIPQFIGQEYFDSTNGIFYKAKGVSAVSDWSRITNA